MKRTRTREPCREVIKGSGMENEIGEEMKTKRTKRERKDRSRRKEEERNGKSKRKGRRKGVRGGPSLAGAIFQTTWTLVNVMVRYFSSWGF